MTKFGENAIEHEIRVWILDPEAGLGSVRSEILNRVLELFRENGDRDPQPAARRPGQGMAASGSQRERPAR